jgi:DNA primase
VSRPRLDFQAIRQIPFAGVLARYNISLKQKDAATLYGNCPLPSHTSKSKDSFFVNVERNVWYCHSNSCKKGSRAGGNVIDFVGAMEKLEPYDAAAKLDGWFGNGRPKPETAAEPREFPPAEAGGNKPLPFALKDVNPEHAMIQARGITTETAKAWGVGFFPGKGSMAGRIAFPLHENGHLVGYAGRATLEGQEPKWLLGKGLVKSFLFGIERCDPAKPLIVAESPWAVLWLWQNGAQAAALLGSEMTAGQEKCLAPFRVITVALDNDAAGNEKAAPIVERLKAAGHTVRKARLLE